MVLVYDYYGLNVFFRKTVTTPVSVFASRADKESCILITFNDGLVNSINFEDSTNPLDEEDKATFMLLVEKNVSEIVKFWLDAFLYNKEIVPEVIKSNIRENA